MISKKLKNNSGASLMLALLFFLLCALAGSVVLAAGTAAAGRMKDVKATEQAYFTVTSAAKLLRDEIDGRSLICDFSKESPEWIQEPGGILNNLLKNDVENIAGQLYSQTGKVTKFPSTELTVEPPADSEELKAVTAEFSMLYTETDEDADYKIVIVLSLKDAAADEPNYTCTLTIPAAILNKGPEDSGIDDGGAEGDPEDDSKTLSLVWTNPTITRGR